MFIWQPYDLICSLRGGFMEPECMRETAPLRHKVKYRLKRGKSSASNRHSGAWRSARHGRNFNPRDQIGQLPHVVKGHGGARGAQRVGITGPAMAAAVKAKHGHPGGECA